MRRARTEVTTACPDVCWAAERGRGRGRERGGERERETEERCDGCSVAIAVGEHFRSDSMSHMHFNTSLLLLGSSLCLRNA